MMTQTSTIENVKIDRDREIENLKRELKGLVARGHGGSLKAKEIRQAIKTLGRLISR